MSTLFKGVHYSRGYINVDLNFKSERYLGNSFIYKNSRGYQEFTEHKGYEEYREYEDYKYPRKHYVHI